MPNLDAGVDVETGMAMEMGIAKNLISGRWSMEESLVEKSAKIKVILSLMRFPVTAVVTDCTEMTGMV